MSAPPTRHQKAEAALDGVIDVWRNLPTLNDLKKHDIWSMRRGFLQRRFPRVDGLRVLEVGSGPAHDSLVFAERGAEVTALDVSDTALDLATKFYRTLNLPLTTVQASATELPFDSGRFDLAFNAGVLEHFTDAQLDEVISEMTRVVRPGGTVLAFCPNRYNVFYQSHLRKINTHRYDFERAFSASGIVGRFRRHGLVGLQRSGVHIHPAPNYLLPSWLPKHHRIEPLLRRCFRPAENTDVLHRLKSLVGQDFVVWGRVSKSKGANRRTVRDLSLRGLSSSMQDTPRDQRMAA